MQRGRSIVLIAVLSLFIAGCGTKNPSVVSTTIETRKNGKIIQTVVEDFSEEYYDINELEQLMQEGIEAYNSSVGRKAVSVEDTQVTDGILSCVMEYQNAQAYAGFNGQALFVGTVSEAYEAGYDLNVSLLPADGADITIGKEELLEMGEKHILICREALDVKVWSDVLYYTMDTVSTNDPKRVTVLDDESLTYIVFE